MPISTIVLLIFKNFLMALNKSLFTKSPQCNHSTAAPLISLMVTPESIVALLRASIFPDYHNLVLTTFDYSRRLRNRVAGFYFHIIRLQKGGVILSFDLVRFSVSGTVLFASLIWFDGETQTDGNKKFTMKSCALPGNNFFEIRKTLTKPMSFII
jgi:hypothetical protein